jgi:hypothetical protein
MEIYSPKLIWPILLSADRRKVIPALKVALRMRLVRPLTGNPDDAQSSNHCGNSATPVSCSDRQTA